MSDPANPVKWDMKSLEIPLNGRSSVRIVRLPTKVSFPSPLADLGGHEDVWTSIVGAVSSPVTRKLFQAVLQKNQEVPLRKVVSDETDGLASDRRYGMIAYMEESEQDLPKDGPRQDWVVIRQRLALKRVDSDYVLQVDANEPLFQLNQELNTPQITRLTTPLDIRRLSGTTNQGEELHEYFVVNLSPMSIHINNLVIRPQNVAGPLPEFAFIEFGDAAAFWWHSRNALEYVPAVMPPVRNKVDQKHKINTQNDGRDDILNLVDPPRWKKPKKNYYDKVAAKIGSVRRADPDSDPEPEDAVVLQHCPQKRVSRALTWSAKLEVRLEHWDEWKIERRSKLKSKELEPLPREFATDPPLQFNARTLVDIDAVCSAIAAVAMGFGKGSEERQKFAYGSTSSIRYLTQAKKPSSQVNIVHRRHPLIMPLWLYAAERPDSPEGDPWGKMKRGAKKEDSPTCMMLAIAFRAPEEAPYDVELHIWNPQVKQLSVEKAMRAPMNIVQMSDWYNDAVPHQPGHHQLIMEPEKEKPLLFDVIFEPCPETTDVFEASVHVILTAWTYALAYPLATTRRSVVHDPAFYTSALDIINRALAGEMDGHTITAFFNAHNYAGAQTNPNTAPLYHPNMTLKTIHIGRDNSFERKMKQLIWDRKEWEERKLSDLRKGSRRLFRTRAPIPFARSE